jgi:predicted protein tyrosine phosphatase
MKGRVNTGAMANQGASTTWNRPGNSPADKIRAFSGETTVLPPLSSLPVDTPGPGLNIKRDTRDDDKRHYEYVRRDRRPSGEHIDHANQIDVNVFIGDSEAAQDRAFLTSIGITNVINTAAEIPNFFQGKLRYFNLSLKDNPQPGDEDLLGVLERTYRYISAVIRYNPSAKILVHCHKGISRSSSIVIYYLMRTRKWGFDEALDFARTKRPIVSPNKWYTIQLQDAEKLLASNGR